MDQLRSWVNWEPGPCQRNLGQPLKPLPHKRDELIKSIAVEFPAFSADSTIAVMDGAAAKIPSELAQCHVSRYEVYCLPNL